MAGSIPTLSNENFHIFEPSPIESVLANKAAASPGSALALLAGYQANRNASGAAYQDQLDTMHKQQLLEAMWQHQHTGAADSIALLKEAGTAPGILDAARSSNYLNNLVPANTGALEQGATTAANAKNFGLAARGAGTGAVGGLQFSPQLLNNVGLAGTTQGAPAIVQAAQIRGPSGARPPPADTVNIPVPGTSGAVLTGHLKPGETGAQGVARLTPPATAYTGGLPPLPAAQGQPNTPPDSTAGTALPTPAANPAVASRIMRLPPAQQQDVAAAYQRDKQVTTVNTPSGPAVVGHSGQQYALPQ